MTWSGKSLGHSHHGKGSRILLEHIGHLLNPEFGYLSCDTDPQEIGWVSWHVLHYLQLQTIWTLCEVCTEPPVFLALLKEELKHARPFKVKPHWILSNMNYCLFLHHNLNHTSNIEVFHFDDSHKLPIISWTCLKTWPSLSCLCFSTGVPRTPRVLQKVARCSMKNSDK